MIGIRLSMLWLLIGYSVTLRSAELEQAWDYAPYRVLIWLSADDPSINADAVGKDLRAYLDRDFAAVWRAEIANAPTSIRSISARAIGQLDYQVITASDPVLAVKRDHPDAVRIRTPSNVGEFCKSIFGTRGRIDDVTARAIELGDPTINGVASRLKVVAGDELTVSQSWADSQTEALLVSRGIAKTLVDPEAKLISPPITGLVGEAVDAYDKIFIVHVRRSQTPAAVDVVELDTLMQHFGPVVTTRFSSSSDLASAIGRGITSAFAPIVRIENAGQRTATGLLRAGGLILDKASPAAVSIGDALQPMVRKNDRNGSPVVIGPLDWALLLTTEIKGRYLEMDLYAGRGGGLQGRKNKRTFRTALKVRPLGESTQLRLYQRQNENFPLIGYELYERQLNSKQMTFVGRTDWNGRLKIAKTGDPLRLLYVKNGGAVLARLPIVPGLDPTATADLSGDDLRLQAEAYVRGAQNDITDLVAIRELYKARIRLQLQHGELQKAESLMSELRRQPNHETLSTAIGKKQIEFIKEIGNKNMSQRRKVDELFTTTKELLSKYISPKLIRQLEADLIAARENGGKLPSADVQPEAG